MFSPDDTIVAIATPAGRGALGVVRISGPLALSVAGAILTRSQPLNPREATFTRIRLTQPADSRASIADTVVATSFPGPHSYTGQDVVELSAHGSPVILHAIVKAAIESGARLARPGEFTLRAFLSGKLDLVQAEAVGDLIAAATPLQARVAFDQLEGTLTRRITELDAELFDLIVKLEASLDFPDEGYHFIEPAEITAKVDRVLSTLAEILGDANKGRRIREGSLVVFSGRTNVGKSSLFNGLYGSDRAIVTETPGTTRDLITEPLEIEGLAVTLVDTAGAREALDAVEREGIARGTQARDVADLVLVVLDASTPLDPEDESILERTKDVSRIVVLNKIDRGEVFELPGAIRVSATRGDGLPQLRQQIRAELTGGESLRDTAAVSNLRHITLLEDARTHLQHARAAASEGTPEEFLLVDLQAARSRFDEMVGVRTPDDVLRQIFERFCIGK